MLQQLEGTWRGGGDALQRAARQHRLQQPADLHAGAGVGGPGATAAGTPGAAHQRVHLIDPAQEPARGKRFNLPEEPYVQVIAPAVEAAGRPETKGGCQAKPKATRSLLLQLFSEFCGSNMLQQMQNTYAVHSCVVRLSQNQGARRRAGRSHQDDVAGGGNVRQ